MKCYSDILNQIGRIDALFSATDFNPRYDRLYAVAIKAFYHYKSNMTKYLARFNEVGNDAGENGYWEAIWDRNGNTKLPREIYAGY